MWRLTISEYTVNDKSIHPKAGLYLHIPFCVRKCPYCDFYSTTDRTLVDPFVDALIAEMNMRRCPDPVFDSIYIGGGTPSVLDELSVSRIIAAAHQAFVIEEGVEITIEANPGTVSDTWLKACRSVGINRINIGVQSFDDGNLALLGRVHTAGEAEAALRMAESSGFENIGLDLIYALPGQTLKNWRVDLAAAVSYRPAHISCYMLTWEPGTRIEADRQAGKLRPLPDSRQAAFFLEADRQLTRQGYAHYEISNFAASGLRSRHNAKYWNNAPYIGLGPAAHSYAEPIRSWNVRSVQEYIRIIASGSLPVSQTETLDQEQRMIEAIYLGLRQADGIDFEVFRRRFKVDFKAEFSVLIDRFATTGDLIVDDRGCRLTVKGLLMQEAIAGEFIEKV